MGRNIVDFSLEELKNYKPELTNKPESFDWFWRKQKERLNNFHPSVTISERDYSAKTVDVFDLCLTSFDETPLKGVLIKPKGVDNCPVVLCFHGYTGYRGEVVNHLKWTTLGYAVVAFDVRGQGDSPDYAKYTNGSRVQGWMLQGILEAENYYYTNVYRDCLIQLNWLRSDEFPVEPSILGVMGASQGGGLALATAGLNPTIDFAIVDYPFLSNFERALEVALTGPYLEIIKYFKLNDPQYQTYEQVVKTLGYIDSVHFCPLIRCPVLMAVALEDSITPPSTVYAAYNHLASQEKHIEIYPQFAHEAIPFHEEKKLAFLSKVEKYC
ncbi:acetylxylan esterase [Fredinandcohnia onubensis]|uniref:acetylxylan esterase n=1 Tax=Fredinandcohnia onubensis TaxID=1571209 RepID=UPI000C0BE757|nr:alpha/beta fold hydrolase [Fredinandcohnia onubensis]